MNIRIDKKGQLYIDGIMKLCPFGKMFACGNECALFTYAITYDGKSADITLCHRTYSIPAEDFQIKDDYYENKKYRDKFKPINNIEGGY
jgi:hypothetical protein